MVKVDHETRWYSRLLKNRGARLLNMGLKKSQTHSYPAHTVNKCCMLLSVILFLYSYRSTVPGKMSHLASTFTFSSWICALHTSLLINVAGTLRRPAGSLTRSAGTPYRLVPAHFYHWYRIVCYISIKDKIIITHVSEYAKKLRTDYRQLMDV